MSIDPDELNHYLNKGDDPEVKAWLHLVPEEGWAGDDPDSDPRYFEIPNEMQERDRRLATLRKFVDTMADSFTVYHQGGIVRVKDAGFEDDDPWGADTARLIEKHFQPELQRFVPREGHWRLGMRHE